MRLTEVVPTQAIKPVRTKRIDRKRVLTSGDAGKILPLAFIPLLREDSCRGRYNINFQMGETAEMLMNGVAVTAYAHFVPHLALERFTGMDALNRSYKGEPEEEGGTPIDYYQTMSFDRDAAFWKTLGVHAAQGADVNNMPVEAYNCIANYRRRARSESLTQRTRLDTSLAEAFWKNNGMQHIVADFDQALIDGEVSLTGLTFKAPVYADKRGTVSTGNYYPISDAEDGGNMTTPSGEELTAWKFNEIWAELTQGGNATMSLSDIEQAKKTAAFARIRSQMDGIEDDHIIDLLMEGIRVPEQALNQPILLDRQQTIFGYQQRYATDSGNLDESVTQGVANLSVNVRCPQMNTGGLIMITAEVVPEQLYERKKDYFLYETDVDKYPNFLRDTLDPEKISVVKNSHVDVLHSQPDQTFGYSYLNHEWDRDLVNVGGKYQRPTDDAFSEDRQKIWSSEVSDPALNDEFILSGTLHKKVFADQTVDSFEITALGACEISGNTVKGMQLQEATDDYEVITDMVDATRIEKE